jgi:hypothetical protein
MGRGISLLLPSQFYKDYALRSFYKVEVYMNDGFLIILCVLLADLDKEFEEQENEDEDEYNLED